MRKKKTSSTWVIIILVALLLGLFLGLGDEQVGNIIIGVVVGCGGSVLLLAMVIMLVLYQSRR